MDTGCIVFCQGNLLKGRIYNSPEEQRLSHFLRDLCDRILGSEVTVRSEHRVNVIGDELLRHPFCISSVEDHTFIIQEINIDKLDILLSEHRLNDHKAAIETFTAL